MKNMKICFLTNTPFEIGGVERVLTVIANELSKENEITILCTKLKKIDYSLYNLSHSINVDVIEELNTQKNKYIIQKVIKRINNKFRIKNIRLLKEIYFPNKENKKYVKYFNQKSFDLIIGVQDQMSLLLAILKPQLNCKVVGWFHNSYEAYFNTPKQYFWHQEILLKNYIENLEKCIVLTKYDRELYTMNFGPYFMDIYNPVTCNKGQLSSLKNGVILFVGRLTMRQKGLDYIIEIAKRINLTSLNYKIWIVGDGNDRCKLEQIIKDNKLEEVIQLKGPTNQVEQYYNKADVLINTSRWEGFGLVLTEALSYGVPVISFKTEGPSEIVMSSCGVLIDKYNLEEYARMLEKIISDYSYRSEMGKNSIIRSKDFELDVIIERWNNLIKELIVR